MMIELNDLKKNKASIDKIENELTKEKNISLSILRLDKIHPAISGNKIFKLYFFLKEALSTKNKIITFGGAYSNHLAATASACNRLGIGCIGIVRGEESKKLSHTLSYCKEQGMQLKFISRKDYELKDGNKFRSTLKEEFGKHVLVPEGGFNAEGMRGASLISGFYNASDHTHICCAVGTATTLAGLIRSSQPSQQIIGFSALKNLEDFDERIQYLINEPVSNNYSLISDHHFGGYAKQNSELINFMNKFYHDFNIPTDFVYTAKMMFGTFDKIKTDHFAKGSKILCIHTGGLQGNLSLPEGALDF